MNLKQESSLSSWYLAYLRRNVLLKAKEVNLTPMTMLETDKELLKELSSQAMNREAHNLEAITDQVESLFARDQFYARLLLLLALLFSVLMIFIVCRSLLLS